MSFAIDPKLHDQFKEATAAQYEKMSQVIVRFIKQYVDEYQAKQSLHGVSKKGGRR
jgi:metal-responsive CopG/Arc/MetJ family transcriptional regulator